MASLADFGDMIIQTQCLVEYDADVTVLRADAEGETLESPIVMVSIDTLSRLPEDITMTSLVLLSFIISLCKIIHIRISSMQA